MNDGARTYTWKHGRQLASLSMGGVEWNYTYNADGMRTSRTNGSTTYTYTYNGDKLTYLIANNHQMYFAYDANGLPMSMILDGVMYYYVTNVQGDVIALVDSSGTEKVSYSYDAWGNPISTTGTLASTVGVLNPLRYRGYVYDQETGLYYLQSRYYNPEIGRFINADALASTGQGLLGNNMFVYCNNNPIVLVDVTGTTPAAAETLSLIGSSLLGLAALLDAATPFLEIAALAVVVIGGAVVAGNYIASEIDRINKEKAKVISTTKTVESSSQAVFYGMDLYGGAFNTRTGPMTFDEAILWAESKALSGVYSDRASWGLYTEKEDDALSMAIALGPVDICGSVIHDKPRRAHLGHFHTINRCIGGNCAHSFHIWYG